MRDAANITIRELIVHILDPQGQGLVQAKIGIPLVTSQPLVD
jgi:hypothetical protein